MVKVCHKIEIANYLLSMNHDFATGWTFALLCSNVRHRLTAHGIGFYTSGQLFLEEYYALAMVGKAGLNTLHMSVLQSVPLPQTDSF